MSLIRPKQRVKIIHANGEVEYGAVFSIGQDGVITVLLDDGDEDHYFAVVFDWNEADKQWIVDCR